VNLAVLAVVALLAADGAPASTSLSSSPDAAPPTLETALAVATPTTPATAPPAPPAPPAPLQRCIQQAQDDVDGGARCLQALVDAGGADAAAAAEALRVLVRLRRHRSASTPAPATSPLTLSSAWLQRGVVEAGLHGVVLGGVAGFVGASAVAAGLRTSEADSLPWLVVAPAAGAVVGGALATAGVVATNAAPDDIALVASTTWAGLALATGLQLSFLSGSPDVAAPALGFSTMLLGTVTGLGAGLAIAPYIDATAGDVALANTALVWGSVLGVQAASMAVAAGNSLDFGEIALWTTTGGGAAWLVTLALHPLFSLHRLSTWLIDAGGVAGFLLAGSALVATASTFTTNGPLLIAGGLTAGTVVGLVAGGIAATFVDAQLSDDVNDADAPPPLLSRVLPAILPTPAGRTAAGVVVEVARW
jgi:hypothetical protein